LDRFARRDDLSRVVLGVRLGEVGAAGDRWTTSECAVGPVVVIPVQPGCEGGPAGSFADVQPPVGPALDQGAVEPLDLAVGLRPIRPGRPGSDVELLAGLVPELAVVTAAVVGQDPLDDDAVVGEQAWARVRNPIAVWRRSSGWISA
jgi:hypothetical protein